MGERFPPKYPLSFALLDFRLFLMLLSLKATWHLCLEVSCGCPVVLNSAPLTTQMIQEGTQRGCWSAGGLASVPLAAPLAPRLVRLCGWECTLSSVEPPLWPGCLPDPQGPTG